MLSNCFINELADAADVADAVDVADVVAAVDEPDENRFVMTTAMPITANKSADKIALVLTGILNITDNS